MTLRLLEFAALPAKLALTALSEARLVERDDNTLNTELVAVKDTVVMKGVVAAMDMVGVLERP